MKSAKNDILVIQKAKEILNQTYNSNQDKLLIIGYIKRNIEINDIFIPNDIQQLIQL